MPDAPRFPYPAWVVWREDLDEAITKTALSTLRRVANAVDEEQTEVIDELATLTPDGEVQVLGDHVKTVAEGHEALKPALSLSFILFSQAES